MKLLLALLFITSSAFAVENWRAVGTDTSTTWMKKADCLKAEKSKANFKGCFDITNKDLRFHQIVKIDDTAHPIYRSPNDSEVKIDCNDPDDCVDKMLVKDQGQPTGQNVCDQHGLDPKYDKSESWTSVVGLSGDYFIWCEKVIGYQKKDSLVVDETLKGQVEASDIQAQQIEQIEVEGSKAIDLGAKVKSVMVGMIKLKNLPKAKRKALRGALKSIIEALDVGSIDIAIEEIKALTEDGEVVTPEAKALILGIFAQAGYDVG